MNLNPKYQEILHFYTNLTINRNVYPSRVVIYENWLLAIDKLEKSRRKP